MIGEKFEYLFILLTFGLTGFALTYDRLRSLLREKAFWISMALFCMYCFGIEITALALGWWSFNENKVIGFHLWRIPFEEMLLFPITFSIITAVFESQRND